jgi:tRNA A-37 threonylcarbamoyl transferase component Bud32
MAMPSERLSAGSLQVGTVVNDRYELLDKLGRGGMSEVYRARDLKIQRDVAVKLMHRHLAADEDAIKRFKREAVATSELKHQNIIDIFAFGIWDNRPYIVMELIEGTNLFDLLKAEGHLSLERAMPIFSQVVDALEFAHSRGVVHRDLKPGNIMLVGSPPTVKVVDFGIAKILPESGKEMQKLTQTGELFGTIIYMSPEQCMSMPLDGRSDIYSLGCIMYETLEGTPPLVANESIATMAKHLNEQVSDGKLIAPAFMNVVRRCLEKEPQKRPSAPELRTLLNDPRRARYGTVRDKHLRLGVGVFAISVLVLLLVFSRLFPNPGQPHTVTVVKAKHGTYAGTDLLRSMVEETNYNPVSGDARTGDHYLFSKALKEKDTATKAELLRRYIATCPTAGFYADVIEARLMLGDCYSMESKFPEADDQFSACIKQLEPFKREKKDDYLRAVFGMGNVNCNLDKPICESQFKTITNERDVLLRTNKDLLAQAELQLYYYYSRHGRAEEARQALASAHTDSRGESSESTVDKTVLKMSDLIRFPKKQSQP